VFFLSFFIYSALVENKGLISGRRLGPCLAQSASDPRLSSYLSVSELTGPLHVLCVFYLDRLMKS